MKRRVLLNLVSLILASGTAFASSNLEQTETGPAVWVFLAFLGVLIVMQLIPGLTLFFSMIKGIFSRVPRQQNLVNEKKSGQTL